MAVDDHAIDSLRTWFDIEYDELKKEWKSGQYERLAECPSYKATAAYQEAINILNKARYGDSHKSIPLEEKIAEELELEQFWESRK